jgi:hypothetical protein
MGKGLIAKVPITDVNNYCGSGKISLPQPGCMPEGGYALILNVTQFKNL